MIEFLLARAPVRFDRRNEFGRLSALSMLLLCCCNPRAFDSLSRKHGQAVHDAGAKEAIDAGGTSSATSEDAGSACGDTSANPEHCGMCNAHCVPSEYALAACVDGNCVEHVFSVGQLKDSKEHGNLTGGGSFQQLCDADEVLIGWRGVAERWPFSIGIDCGHIELHPASSGYVARVVPTKHEMPFKPNLADDWMLHDYTLACPADAIVTAVSMTTHTAPEATTLSIGYLELTCAHLTVDAQRNVTLVPIAQTQAEGSKDEEGSTLYHEACAKNGVVTGLKGRQGAYIDSLAIQSGVLSISEQPAAVE